MKTHRWNSADALACVFAMMDQEKFSADTRAIHNALHDLSNDPRFCEFFGELSFRDEGRFFYSQEINTYMTAWEMADMLSCLAPWYEEYIMLPKMRTHYKTYREKLFSEQELEVIKKASKILEKKIAQVKKAV